MAITANLEYRLNYAVDAVVQPLLTTGIEILLWTAVFRSAGTETIGGFSLHHYLAYALWGSFFARIAASWMYEYRMIEEIESGSINGLLVRPMSFYEYYFSQLLGYKAITTAVSFAIPLVASMLLPWPVDLARLPLAVTMVFYYLILVHSLSFCVSSMAFFLNRIHALTAAKNLTLWVLSGEIVPLDLFPEPFRSWLIDLPFSAAVFLPVGYLTGRVELAGMYRGFVSITLGIVAVNLLGYFLWKRGLRSYVGTGA